MYLSAANYIPQSGSLRRPLLVWLIAAVGTVGLLSLIVGAPVALSTGHPFWGITIYHSFSLVCHQIPERSFFIAGHQFAVCARCTGLYAGFAAASVLYPLLRSLRQTEAPPRKWLFIAAAPLGIDFSLTFLGIWENTHSTRFITGALLGAVAVFYVMPGLMDLSLRQWGSKAERLTSTTQSVTSEMFSTPATTAPSDYSAPHRRI